jgi:hypothetical protein
MTDVKITGLTISGDSIIIEYSGGAKPVINYGYNACKTYWDKQPDKSILNATQLAHIWILATGDLKGARTGKIDGCGSSSQSECLNTCISAVTQAEGECQAIASFLSKDRGSCKVNDTGGGIWQVSNYNSDPIRDVSPCNTLPSLTDPCCAARAAFLHAKYACSGETFTSGTKKGKQVPDCPRYQNTKTDWDTLSIKGGPAHEPCWNGPFCIDSSDGDWLQESPAQVHPDPKCPSKTEKSKCDSKECIWYDGSRAKSQCLGGFDGWEDSWSKYAYARCCDDTGGCIAPGLPPTFSCFNSDSQASFELLKKFALASDKKGVGQSYLKIATDACNSVINKYYN